MDLRISPRKISGTFRAPPSKSEFHRALILAALSNARTVITGVGASELSDDIIRTADAIRSLGASLDMGKDGITVTPPEEYEKKRGDRLRRKRLDASFHAPGLRRARRQLPLYSARQTSRPSDILSDGYAYRKRRFIQQGRMRSSYERTP
jgi:hypothetical protein